MHTSSKKKLYTICRPPIHVLRFCLCAFLFLIASVTILLVGQAQQAMATGESVVVMLGGAPGQLDISPSLLTIHIYDTVIFVNQSTTSYAVAADDSSFSSPAILHNRQWSTTFSVLGAHSYHTTSATTDGTAIGEILVVADNVALLPVPQPQIEATALAIIQAGKHPPDVIQLPTTSTAAPSPHFHPQQHLQAWLLSFPVSTIAGGLLAFFVFILVLLIVRSRRKLRSSLDDDEWTDDTFSDTYNTHAYQGATSSTTSATVIAQEVQQTQKTKTIYSSQTPTIAWYRRLFQTIQTRIRAHTKNKDDEDYEDYEDYEDEE